MKEINIELSDLAEELALSLFHGDTISVMGKAEGNIYLLDMDIISAERANGKVYFGARIDCGKSSIRVMGVSENERVANIVVENPEKLKTFCLNKYQKEEV